MSILTDPIFYYIDPIDTNNKLMNFDEGGGELTATLNVGSRAMSDLMTEVSRALTAAGGQTYTVSLARNTRLVTISASANFDLLVSTGSNIGLDPFSLLGFNGADRTGTNSYEGDTPIGTEYCPQFPLQEFKNFEHNKEGLFSSLNESASGVVEIVSFGSKRVMSFNIKYITDYTKDKTSRIKNNPTGIQDAIDFMEFVITKSNIEFMQDKTNRNSFEITYLQSTRKSKDGTAFELKELYAQNLLGYFETGTLTFRKVES